MQGTHTGHAPKQHLVLPPGFTLTDGLVENFIDAGELLLQLPAVGPNTPGDGGGSRAEAVVLGDRCRGPGDAWRGRLQDLGLLLDHGE